MSDRVLGRQGGAELTSIERDVLAALADLADPAAPEVLADYTELDEELIDGLLVGLGALELVEPDDEAGGDHWTLTPAGEAWLRRSNKRLETKLGEARSRYHRHSRGEVLGDYHEWRKMHGLADLDHNFRRWLREEVPRRRAAADARANAESPPPE